MFPSLAPVLTGQKKLSDRKPGITVLSYAQAYALIEEGRALLLDVREPAEFMSGAVINAKNVPLDDIRKGSLPAFAQEYRLKPVIVYCRSGRRSAEAAKCLYEQGFRYLYDMGGISSWPYGTVTPAGA